MLLSRPLRPLLVLLMILMMLLITLMMLSDSHCFWRALVWLFVSIFLIWAVEAKTKDDGYLARLVAHLATLASWPFISRQGSRVRPFVFMTNLPAKKTRVKSEVCSGSTSNVRDYFLLNSGLCGQHVDGPARRRLISFVFRPPVRNDMVSCVDFDWRQRGSDDDDDDVLIAGYSVSSIDVGGVNLLIALTFVVLFTVTRSTISRN